MVDIDRRDDHACRVGNDIGRVEGAAHPDLKQQVVGGGVGEQLQRRRGGDLELRDRLAAIDPLDGLQHLVELARAHQLTGQPDALVEAHQMRRGEDVDALARGFEEGPQVGHGRALAIGARHMDHRRQVVLRIAELLQQPVFAVQLQVHEPGIERGKPLEDGVGMGHGS